MTDPRSSAGAQGQPHPGPSPMHGAPHTAPGQPAYPYGPPAYQPPAPMPPVVINNAVNATAMAGGYGWRKRNSVAVHVVLFLFTAGLGNIAYAWYVHNWNRRHGLR